MADLNAVMTIEEFKKYALDWKIVSAGTEALSKTPEELEKDKSYQKAKKVYEAGLGTFLKGVIAPNFWDIKLFAKECLWIVDSQGVEIFSIDGPMQITTKPFEGAIIRVHRADMKHDGYAIYAHVGNKLVPRGTSFGKRIGQ